MKHGLFHLVNTLFFEAPIIVFYLAAALIIVFFLHLEKNAAKMLFVPAVKIILATSISAQRRNIISRY